MGKFRTDLRGNGQTAKDVLQIGFRWPSRLRPSRRTLWLAIAFFSLIAALYLIPNHSARHPMFGKIRTSVALDDGLPLENLRQKLRIENLLARFNLWQTRGYVLLDLEGHRLFWWDRQWDPVRLGCLQFQTLRAPKDVWQFAPCSRGRLEDVRWSDLPCDFYGSTNPAGKKAFGSDWQAHRQLKDSDTESIGRAIDVREGQVVLARLVNKPLRIYAIEITKQDRRPKTGGVRLTVRYVSIDTAKTPRLAERRDSK